jgi:hypothetical protein
MLSSGPCFRAGHAIEEDTVAHYLLVYRGGAIGVGDAAMAAAMERWERWFAGLGDAVVDWGSPLGRAATVSSDRTVAGRGTSALTGYSILAADSLGAATDAAKDCPVLAAGGFVEVYEATPIG